MKNLSQAREACPKFAPLLALKAAGLSVSAELLVLAFVEENGRAPVGVIADACQVSISSVEKALAKLRGLGLSVKNEGHDHDQDHGFKKRTAEDVTARPVKTSAESTAAAPADPLREQLLEHQVLPWCVDVLMTKVPREQLERQLGYHTHRLEAGFKFTGHPAKYLFRACLHDYAAPAGYYERRHLERQGHVEASTPAAATAPRPVDAPAAKMTREGALQVIRLGIKSKLPQLRRQAEELAAEWGIDLRQFAC